MILVLGIIFVGISGLLYVVFGKMESQENDGPRVTIFAGIRNQIKYNIVNLLGIAADIKNKDKNRLGVLKRHPEKVAIITGGSRGLGSEVVKTLYLIGMHIILAVRNVEAGKEFAEKVKRECVKYGDRTIEVMELDVASMKSVKKFAETVKKQHPQIDLLVNNAGVLFSDFKLTEDGFETQLATNYMGHFYLTHLLLDNLKAAGARGKECSRIVNVSSCIHFCADDISFEDINMTKNHHPVTGYARSKLAQLMFTRHLNKMLEAENSPVKCYAAHPGLVATDMFYKTPEFKAFSWMGKILKSPEQGAVSILYCCIAEELENKGGAYISNCEEGSSTEFSKNADHQRRLFELSCNMLNIDKFGSANLAS